MSGPARLVERVTLGLFAALAGGYAVLALLIPQRLARAVYGHPLAPGGVLLHSMMGGMQLGLALVALVCARSRQASCSPSRDRSSAPRCSRSRCRSSAATPRCSASRRWSR